MSISELFTLTDIANRGEFYCARDEFNTAMALGASVDQAIEDLYTLRDVVERGDNIASVEAFIAPDLKELTGSSEISLESLSALVIAGIVAILGAIIALLVWLIRSFSGSGGGGGGSSAPKDLTNDIAEIRKSLRPSEEVNQAFEEVMKLADESTKDTEDLDKRQEKVIQKAKELIAESDSILEQVEIPKEHIPESTEKERANVVNEFTQAWNGINHDDRYDVSKAIKEIHESYSAENQRQIKSIIDKYEQECHNSLRELRKASNDSKITLFDEDGIIDLTSLTSFPGIMNDAVTVIGSKINGISGLIDIASRSFSETKMCIDATARQLATYVHTQKDNTRGEADQTSFKRFLDTLVTEIRSGRHTSFDDHGVLDDYDDRTFKDYRKFHEEVVKLHEYARKNIEDHVVLTGEAFEASMQAVQAMEKKLLSIVNSAKRHSIRDMFRATVSNINKGIVEGLNRMFPFYRDQPLHKNLSEAVKSEISLYQGINLPIMGNFIKNYSGLLDSGRAADKLIETAKELRRKIDTYRNMINNGIPSVINDSNSDDKGWNQTFMKFFNTMADPYLAIASSSKATVSVCIDALYTVRSVANELSDAEVDCRNRLSRVLESIEDSEELRSLTDRMAVDILIQVLKKGVIPQPK